MTSSPDTAKTRATNGSSGHRGHRADLWARPLHRKVNVAGAAALSLVSHVVLLTSWWSGVHTPVVRLTSQAPATEHSAVQVEHTIVRIAQLPPPMTHAVIDDPPAPPDIEPEVSLLAEPEPLEPIPDLVWFDADEDDTAAFTIRARRPRQTVPEALPELDLANKPTPVAAAQDTDPTPPEPKVSAPEVAADTAPSSAGATVVEPRPASDNRPPRYPGAARRRGWEGRVVMHVRVDAKGTPLSVEVTQSSGRDLLDQAAVEAVQAWTFTPARQNSRPIPGETTVSVRFELGT